MRTLSNLRPQTTTDPLPLTNTHFLLLCVKKLLIEREEYDA